MKKIKSDLFSNSASASPVVAPLRKGLIWIFTFAGNNPKQPDYSNVPLHDEESEGAVEVIEVLEKPISIIR